MISDDEQNQRMDKMYSIVIKVIGEAMLNKNEEPFSQSHRSAMVTIAGIIIEQALSGVPIQRTKNILNELNKTILAHKKRGADE